MAILGLILAILDLIFVGFAWFAGFARFAGFAGFARFAKMLPRNAMDLRNSVCGWPLGYGDLAERLEFAVPAGVLAC